MRIIIVGAGVVGSTLAEELGLDMDAFTECVESGRYVAEVEADPAVHVAQRAGQLIERAVDVLAELADGGPAVEFAIGTGRLALPLAAFRACCLGAPGASAGLVRVWDGFAGFVGSLPPH